MDIAAFNFPCYLLLVAVVIGWLTSCMGKCACVLTRPPEEEDHWPLLPINKAGWHSSPSAVVAAVNKFKIATLTLPSAQGRPLTCLHPTFPRKCCSTDTWSHTKLQSSSLSSTIAGPARALRREEQAPLLRQIKIHRLIPPKQSDRRTPPSHCSRTEFPDRLIHDKICDGLPAHVHIMGDCLQTGGLQHLL